MKTKETVTTAKIITSGRNQTVLLPDAFRMEGEEVMVRRHAGGVLLLPVGEAWNSLEAGL